MAILICAATGKELAALAPGLLPKPEDIQEMRPMVADIKHGKAIFMCTGVGPINAALAVGFCLGLTLENDGDMRIEAALNIGLAGAFDLEKNPLRSIWRVQREIWPEYGLNDGVSVTARAFSFPLWQMENGETIYDSLELEDLTALKKWTGGKGGEDWQACASLTVAGATASFARKAALWDNFHAELENMEGFAVAYACARASAPCVELRVVSNKVGPRSRDEKDFEGATQALGQILQALNML